MRMATPITTYSKLEPELAESWDLSDMSVTFKLHKDAKFHDGTPVTIKGVKWTFDRAVSIGGAATFQLAAGSMEKREKFVAVKNYICRVDFLREDKYAMRDIAVPIPGVINSEPRQATRHGPGPVATGPAEEQ